MPDRPRSPDALPEHAELVRVSPVFDQTSVPPGLLRAHRLARGVWGRLVVHDGHVRFAFEDESGEPRTIAAGSAQVIPPERPHHVKLAGAVRFAVEFHRVPEGSSDTVPA